MFPSAQVYHAHGWRYRRPQPRILTHCTVHVQYSTCVTMAMAGAVQVRELQALRQQLEPEVDIPQLQPLRDEVEGLDHLLGALQQLQVGPRLCAADWLLLVHVLCLCGRWLQCRQLTCGYHGAGCLCTRCAMACAVACLLMAYMHTLCVVFAVRPTCWRCARTCVDVHACYVVLQDAHLSMLRKDMSLLDLELLELKLKLKLGEAYSGSPVQVKCWQQQHGL